VIYYVVCIVQLPVLEFTMTCREQKSDADNIRSPLQVSVDLQHNSGLLCLMTTRFIYVYFD